ncbi:MULTISPECIES: toxin YdaT family protein [Enterobacterales]|uniref:toxin YdaT family protein n=1 Tax=Enterobacterales TaxID=91347 RepID=UPI002ED8E4BE
MKISPIVMNSALTAWSAEITQETATRLITATFLSSAHRPELQLHRIELEDGVVDYAAWRRNRISIFQRWRKCQTSEQSKKFELLTPFILESIRHENAELYAMVTAGSSIQYLASRLLRENTDAVNAALLGAPLRDFEKECDEAELAITALRDAYRHQQRHDQ